MNYINNNLIYYYVHYYIYYRYMNYLPRLTGPRLLEVFPHSKQEKGRTHCHHILWHGQHVAIFRVISGNNVQETSSFVKVISILNKGISVISENISYIVCINILTCLGWVGFWMSGRKSRINNHNVELLKSIFQCKVY